MAENSRIGWTTHTFNPWIGCTRVSAACDHCYAEAWDARFRGQGPSHWGPHAARRRTKTWGDPHRWQRAAAAAGVRSRVFCASLADVFDNHRSIDPAWRADLWDLIRATPDLDWLMLTKRPQNIRRYLPQDWGANGYHNVWLGATAEDQAALDQRIPSLTAVPARVRFLSCEPLLGPLDLRGGAGLDWVIAGGESGPSYRATDPAWFRDLRDQCARHDIAFYFKQWSGPSQAAIKAQGRALDGVVHDGFPALRRDWLRADRGRR